jgi:general secretion pathway protein I
VASEVTTSAIHMQDKTLAQWVAMNKVAEMRLQPTWPSTGRSNGDVDMAGRSWHWQMEVKNTEDKDVRRLEVAVLPESDKGAETPTVLVTAFLGRPL